MSLPPSLARLEDWTGIGRRREDFWYYWVALVRLKRVQVKIDY